MLDANVQAAYEAAVAVLAYHQPTVDDPHRRRFSDSQVDIYFEPVATIPKDARGRPKVAVRLRDEDMVITAGGERVLVFREPIDFGLCPSEGFLSLYRPGEWERHLKRLKNYVDLQLDPPSNHQSLERNILGRPKRQNPVKLRRRQERVVADVTKIVRATCGVRPAGSKPQTYSCSNARFRFWLVKTLATNRIVVEYGGQVVFDGEAPYDVYLTPTVFKSGGWEKKLRYLASRY